MPLSEKEYSINELAAQLNQAAQLTAGHSQNWDNFEQICISMMKKVYEAGLEDGS